LTLRRNEALVDSAVGAFGELTRCVGSGGIPSALWLLFRSGNGEIFLFREVLPDVLGSFCARGFDGAVGDV